MQSFIEIIKIFFSLFRKKPISVVINQKKILFIVNPFSGRGKQKKIEKYIHAYLDKTKFSYMLAYTKGPMHANSIAEESKEEVDIIIVVGGDGSVNEVAKALIGSDVILGIIPCGSGNGLARYLKIPIHMRSAIRCINQCFVRQIDTVKINNENFMNIAGIGFDAQVSMEFSNFGKRGLLSYLTIIAKELPSYQPKEYELMIDGRIYKEKAFLICFANSGQYGNNFYIAPHAQIDDGYLDLLIFKEFPKHASGKILFDLINQRINQSKYIEMIKCKDVSIQSDSIHFHIDGEPVEMRGDVHIQVIPSSLRIISGC